MAPDRPGSQGIFTALLRYSNAEIAAEIDDEDTEPSPVSCLQAELVDCLALLMGKEEEAFQPYLSEALSNVWTLLMATGLAPHQDLLVTTAIRFLTTVATSPHHALFGSAEVLQNVCEKIIAPNVQLLAQDEELFEDNAFEYIRRDAEGSDTDTRRRVSCDLVKALCRNYEAQTTTLFSGYVGQLLAQGAGNWKATDAAIYIVVALTLRGSTSQGGATQTNQLVNLEQFFGTTVAPILQAGASSAHQILLADALKFVTVFRNQLPVSVYAAVFPLFGQLLSHRQTVVHTYAAIGIERMLTAREAPPLGAPAGSSGALRFGAPQLAPLLQPLLQGLFGALKLPGSAENAYVMRAILRIAVVAGEHMGPYVTTCVDELKGHLTRVCENPSNPSFNHYIFEAIAALVRSLCDKSSPTASQAVDAFEAMLFPPFQHVLQRDVTEFTPYVFQILSQLLECRTALSPAYISLFPPLLAPVMWERPNNTIPLVRLLSAYLAIGKATVAPELQKVLGVFQKLLASKASDAYACALLGAVWRAFELSELAAMVAPIFQLCLMRLQSNRKVAPSMIGCWAIFVGRYGAPAFRAQLEGVQPGLLAMLFRSVWAENLHLVQGARARKTAGVCVVRLLTECTELAADMATLEPVLRGLLLLLLQDQGMPTTAPLSLAESEEMTETAEIDGPSEGGGGGVGYVAAYVGLSHASAAEEVDLYPGETTLSFSAKALQAIRPALPSVIPGVMQKLTPEQQQGVQALLQAMGLA